MHADEISLGNLDGCGVFGERREVGFEECDVVDGGFRGPGARGGNMRRVEVDRGDLPAWVARRQDQRAEALAAAEFQIADRVVGAWHG